MQDILDRLKQDQNRAMADLALSVLNLQRIAGAIEVVELMLRSQQALPLTGKQRPSVQDGQAAGDNERKSLDDMNRTLQEYDLSGELAELVHRMGHPEV